MDPKRFPIHVVWTGPGEWSVRCTLPGKREIMKFTVLGLQLGEIRWKVEQFLKDTPYEGRRVQIMTGPDDAGKCHPIFCKCIRP